jgi:hypothetical protein
MVEQYRSRTVRIDKTNGFEPQGLPPGGRPAAKPGKLASPTADEAVDGAQIDLTSSALVRQAAASADINAAAVQEARKLLQSGQLDTPAAIRRAAQAIIDTGL